jgi:hypothetical protein
MIPVAYPCANDFLDAMKSGNAFAYLDSYKLENFYTVQLKEDLNAAKRD